MTEQGERDMLREAVARMLVDRSDDLSTAVVEMGLLDLLVPESAGGFGGQLADALVVHSELGRGLACVPYLQCAGARKLTATLGFQTGSGWTSLLVDPETFGWTLQPGAALLPFADCVDAVLVLVDGELREVPVAQLDVRPIESIDPSFPLFEVQVPTDGRSLGLVDKATAITALTEVTLLGRASLCAELVGSAERCLDQISEHVQTRKQFGRAIGSFQAVQHKAADMAIRLEGMRGFLFALADDGQGPDLEASGEASAERTTAMAKAYTSDSARFVIETCLQLYGGLGFTWECPAHLHLRHAHRCGQLLGSPSELRAQHVLEL